MAQADQECDVSAKRPPTSNSVAVGSVWMNIDVTCACLVTYYA